MLYRGKTHSGIIEEYDPRSFTVYTWFKYQETIKLLVNV